MTPFNPPSGDVTFLFTDVEGSTQLWENQPEAMQAALAQHDNLLREVIESHQGYVFKTVGDAFCATFQDPLAALNAALAAQRRLQTPLADIQIKVRMALHSGLAEERDNDYFGPPVNHVARLLSAGHGGQTLLSAAVVANLQGKLPADIELRDLGERRLKDLVQTIHIYQLDAPDLPANFLPLKTLKPVRTNLPTQLTSFIGREKELEQGQNFLTSHRLVSLIGPGGTGKTRLSLQMAATYLDVFLNGVWVIELAPISDAALVPQTVVDTLGLNQSGGNGSLEKLLDFLRARKALLIFDNCEHLIDAAAHMSETLLKTCPQLHLLTSSREPLGVYGEVIFRIPPLSIPQESYSPSIETLLHFDAIRLFVERAQIASLEFRVTEANMSALIQICQQLDGIPLALELAAARVRMLSVEQIAERLNDRFRLLTGGSRTALPRQQTLRALVDWSWDLLSSSERLLLQRLSVFAGNIDLEAAEMICADDNIDAFEILDLLALLVNKSLVNTKREPGKERRYYLLETIRQYASEKLAEAEEDKQFRQNHLDYFLRLGEKSKQGLLGPGYIKWLNLLQNNLDNIRVSLKLSAETDVEKGLRLASALKHFWMARGYLNEGEKWVSQMLAHYQGNNKAVKAQALGVQSTLNMNQYNFPLAREQAEASLSLYQALNDAEGRAYVLNYLAEVLMAQRVEPGKVAALLQESLSIFRSVDNQFGVADALQLLGRYEFYIENNYERANEHWHEILAIYEQNEYIAGVSFIYGWLGLAALSQGDPLTARDWIEKDLRIREQIGIENQVGMLGNAAYSLQLLGDVYAQLGEYQQACHYLLESIDLAQETGVKGAKLWGTVQLGYAYLGAGEMNQAHETLTQSLYQFQEAGLQNGIAFTLEGFAKLFILRDQPRNATILFAQADKIREHIQEPRPPAEQENVTQSIEAILALIDQAAYDQAYAEGQALSIEEARALTQETVV